MIPDNHAKSFLSESYVNAVVTQAGFGCEFTKHDYGIDAIITEIQLLQTGKFMPSGFHFNVQIKASHKFGKTDTEIIYDLEAEAYNKLVYHTGGLIVLILFCVPKISGERIIITEDVLRLHNCCYYFQITGKLTKNKRSKRLCIPRKQLFTPDACNQLMDSVRTGGWKQ